MGEVVQRLFRLATNRALSLTLSLVALVIGMGLFVLPSSAQTSNDDDDPQYRLKRNSAQDHSAPIEHGGKQLQGGITRIGVPDDAGATTPLMGDVRQAFPSIESKQPPLKGQAQFDGPTETPPVLVPGRAVNAPPEMYRGWLEKAHPQFSLQASTMAENRLVVIHDKYDNTERTLSSLGLRFVSMDKQEFDGYDLAGAQVVVVDCGPKNLSPVAMSRIRDFVARGGYLFTTDWMLDKLDQFIFPGYIAWSGAMNRQNMYDAAIVGQEPVLFRHAVTNASWKMDIHCHLIRVLNKQAVRILAVSRSLVADDPDGQGILAVVFPFERGYVMHMTAHFDRSQAMMGYGLPDPAPVIGISLRQAIAINFVVAGLSGERL